MSAQHQPEISAPQPAPLDLADKALMERIRDGDEAALDRLLARYWDLVVAYSRQILGDPDAAADTAQQTFIRIWQRREQWQPTGTVGSYIFRIARNAALNERRARRIRLLSGSDRGCRAMPWTPLESLEETELRAALDGALRRLPARRKEVFLLARFQRLSYLEIAALMGISPQTVANQMSAALADLRRHLVAHL